MPRKAVGPSWSYRGQFDARIPDLRTIVWSAVEALDIPPQVSGPMSSGSRWMLLYFLTPARMAIGRRRKAWVTCPAQTAVLIAPPTPYWLDTGIAPGPSHHIWLLIDGLHYLPVFALTQKGSPCTRFDDPDHVLADELLRYIDIVDTHRDNAFWCMQVGHRSIFDLLAKARLARPTHYRIAADSVAQKIDPMVARILAYLEAHLGERVRLADIARHVHASPSTVSHRYREFAGEAPMQTLRRMRIFKAKSLLLRGELTAHIAARVGFCDERHLWSAFKQSEGISPREFVKATRLTSGESPNL